MGQAKQRGSFEQRKSEAVEIRKILDAEMEKKRAKLQIEIRELEAKMSEEERMRRRKAKRLLASVIGISGGIGLWGLSDGNESRRELRESTAGIGR